MTLKSIIGGDIYINLIFVNVEILIQGSINYISTQYETGSTYQGCTAYTLSNTGVTGGGQ